MPNVPATIPKSDLKFGYGTETSTDSDEPEPPVSTFRAYQFAEHWISFWQMGTFDSNRFITPSQSWTESLSIDQSITIL